ncbi:cupin, partial [Mesorhizobium sp. M7A.F.Ca.CA.002.05.1.1]
MTAKIFAQAGEGAWTKTPDGNRRRVLLHTD